MVEIISNPIELKRKINEEDDRSTKTQENFQKMFVGVDALNDFLDRNKSIKQIVSGTNDGYVFEYKGKLFGALSTNRIYENSNGKPYFIYYLDRIAQNMEKGEFDLALEWINQHGHAIREDINKYGRGLESYKTFQEYFNFSSPQAEKSKKLVQV